MGEYAVFYSLGILVICETVKSIESPVRERDLLPRNFNPHPYTSTGSLPIISNFDHPYAALVAKFSKWYGVESTRQRGETVNRHGDIHRIPIRLQTIGEGTPGDVDSSTGRTSIDNSYKMFLPSRHREIVNYVANDDGYRADISFGQREKPSVPSVQDVSVERDVHTGILLQSANLAKIQSTVVGISEPAVVNAIDGATAQYPTYRPLSQVSIQPSPASGAPDDDFQGGYESIGYISQLPGNLISVNDAGCDYFVNNGKNDYYSLCGGSSHVQFHYSPVRASSIYRS